METIKWQKCPVCLGLKKVIHPSTQMEIDCPVCNGWGIINVTGEPPEEQELMDENKQKP